MNGYVERKQSELGLSHMCRVWSSNPYSCERIKSNNVIRNLNHSTTAPANIGFVIESQPNMQCYMLIDTRNESITAYQRRVGWLILYFYVPYNS